MSPLEAQLAVLPERLGQHLLLSLIALGAGIALSLPLAIAVSRVPALRWPTLTVASVIQTIPSLALLALMVPLLDLLRRGLNAEFSAFGFWPAVIALTLYSLLPVLRNTLTGLLGVDRDLIEAARGLGMTGAQRLWQVELPLATPVILAGVRTSAVWTVGIATLSTPVGQTSLGNYIFAGLQTRNWTAVLVGSAAAALLAMVLDATVALYESAAAKRSRARAVAASVLLLTVVAVGLGPLVVKGDAGPRPVRVGAKTFTEQYILAELLSLRLTEAGLPAEKVEGLGSTVVFDALATGELDVYVDYSGTLWANHLKRKDVAPKEEVLEGVTAFLREEHGIEVLGGLGFENAYALAMRREVAEQLAVTTIEELAAVAPRLSLGSDYEFFSRPEWTRLEGTYGLKFERKVSLDSTLMYEAVRTGEVEVITAFTSDGRIAAYDLLVLEDPRHAFPPYEAVLLVSADALDRWPFLPDALRPLLGRIDVERMREANQKVDLNGWSRMKAAAWLDETLDDALEE